MLRAAGARRLVRRVDPLLGPLWLHSRVAKPGAKIKLLARVAPGPPAGDGRRAKSTLPPLEVLYEDEQLAP